MARGTPKGVRIGGRQKGTPNKLTVERERLAALEAEARDAEAKLRGAVAAKAPLGREVLSEFMVIFRGVASRYYKLMSDAMNSGLPVPKDAESKFMQFAKLAVDTAADVAEYQSPKYKAIAVTVQEPPQRPGDDAKVIEMGGKRPQAERSSAYRRLIAAG